MAAEEKIEKLNQSKVPIIVNFEVDPQTIDKGVFKKAVSKGIIAHKFGFYGSFGGV